MQVVAAYHVEVIVPISKIIMFGTLIAVFSLLGLLSDAVSCHLFHTMIEGSLHPKGEPRREI